MSAEKSRQEALRNFIASGCTGAITMAATNPLDCLKARWQVAPHEGQTLKRFFWNILRTEGLVQGLWRHALLINIAACTVSMGTRIGIYPSVRDMMCAKQSGAGEAAVKMFIAGLMSGMAGYFTASPLFQIKTQMQSESGLLKDGVYITGAKAGHPPTYRSAIDGLWRTARDHGVRGLWSGSVMFTARGATLSSTQLMTYDGTKTTLIRKGVMQDGPVLHVLASVVASVCLTTAVMPLDVTLTRFQASKVLKGGRFASPLAAARHILSHHGPSAFMRGWSAMFLRMCPTGIATFFIYERIRLLLGLGYLD